MIVLVGIAGLTVSAQRKMMPDGAASASAAATAPRPSANAPWPYRIGPGDVLQINVYKEPEASLASVVVRSDGMVALPLIKEIRASGLTPAELEQQITAALNRIIRDADATVLVREIHSEKIYVIGAVRKEGPITLQTPLTVLQAISEAGGLTDYAKKSRIYVLRRERDAETKIRIDYPAALSGSRPDQNILLHPGDTLVVP
ncbi:MAG TPA: polysaccharide biosynthesis/export family protein [Bryobacteraceae bacterium]|nr:polysaccharide biosynthesis/export family protein [Bryobacteraceae bacterium]